MREQLLEEVEPMLVSSRVTVTAGTDEFFEAQTTAEHPRYRSPVVRFIRDLAWVYPITLFVAVGLAPHLALILGVAARASHNRLCRGNIPTCLATDSTTNRETPSTPTRDHSQVR